MLKIPRKANGDVVLTVSGRLVADNASELSALLAAEPAGRALVLDLKDVVLVDRDIVQFLRACGIALTITRNWRAWEGGRIEQVTNDAYVRRDLTPLST
jgi:hypothetical protein